MLDGEALDLMKLGFRRCFYLELECRQHGSIRIASETKPTKHYPCPICQNICPASGLLCTGWSRRELPFYEIVSGAQFLRKLNHSRYVTKLDPTRPIAVVPGKRAAVSVG